MATEPAPGDRPRRPAARPRRRIAASAVGRRARPSAPVSRGAPPPGSSRPSSARASSSASAIAAASAGAPSASALRPATPRQTLVELAQPSLRRLADASGETINLAVPGPAGVEHLAQEDTAHFVGVTDWVGRKVPFDQAANGKCFLAFGGGEARPAQPDRGRGFARSIDELEVGLTAARCTGLGADGEAVAALSISGPTPRLTSERIAQLAPLLSRQRGSRAARPRRREVPHDARGGSAGAVREHAGRPCARGQGARHRRARRRHGAGIDAVRRAHPVARGGRCALRARRLFRPRDADRRARDAGRARHPQAAARRDRCQPKSAPT